MAIEPFSSSMGELGKGLSESLEDVFCLTEKLEPS